MTPARLLRAALALAQPTPAPSRSVFPCVKLGFNTGAGFGLLSGFMSGRVLLMAGATGALGNILDRLRQGAATDCLDPYGRDWRRPSFNLADFAISLGVAAYVLGGWRDQRLS